MTTDCISNSEINAEDCYNCGATWKRCLRGYSDDRDDGPHPAGVCCRKCHETDTHNADAARRREAERRARETGRHAVSAQVSDLERALEAGREAIRDKDLELSRLRREFSLLNRKFAMTQRDLIESLSDEALLAELRRRIEKKEN